jgi:hypothetical protein
VHQRKKIRIAIGVLVALVAAGVVAWRTTAPSSHPFTSPRAISLSAGRAVPPSATSTVQLLVSANGRRALTPELNAVTGSGQASQAGQLFAAGTTFTVQPNSWHQDGAYANLAGILRIPKHAPVRVDVGLVRRGARWLVTFEGPAQ